MDNLTEIEKAYLAGLFDGDGYIGIRKQYPSPDRMQYVMSVVLTLTDKPTLEFWIEKTGIGSFCTLPRNATGRKPVYQWRLAAKKGESLLRMIYPYLMIRKSQADIAFRFRKTISRSMYNRGRNKDLYEIAMKKREELMQELQQIKKKNYYK